MIQEKKVHKILLVDDDPVANNLAKRAIEKAGIAENISVVTDGQEALDYLTNPHKSFPELIFLDISMPVMDGFEFLKRFSETSFLEKEQTRIIVLSSFYNEDEVKDVADYDEVIGYIPKPLDQEKIFHAIDHYLKKVNAVD